MRHRDRVPSSRRRDRSRREPWRVSHHLCFFPYLRNLREFSKSWAVHHQSRALFPARRSVRQGMACVVADTAGSGPGPCLHAHKSVYGNAGRRCQEIFGNGSPNCGRGIGPLQRSHLADRIEELRESDLLIQFRRHSLEKIAREYNVVRMEKPNFRELVLALRARRVAGCWPTMAPTRGWAVITDSFCLVCESLRPSKGSRSWPAAIAGAPAQGLCSGRLGSCERHRRPRRGPSSRPPTGVPLPVPLSFLRPRREDPQTASARLREPKNGGAPPGARSQLIPLVGAAMADETWLPGAAPAA